MNDPLFYRSLYEIIIESDEAVQNYSKDNISCMYVYSVKV